MKAKFYSPFELNDTTGGTIYNKALIDWIKGRGIEIEYVQSNDPNTIEWTRSTTHFLDGPFCRYAIKPEGKTVALVHLPTYADPEASQHDLDNEYAVLHSVSLIIVPHELVKVELVDRYGISNHKILTIEPGLTHNDLKGHYPQIPFSLIYAANFSRIKNHEGLMKVLSTVRNLNWSLDCYGAGELQPHIKELCKALGLEKKVTLLPPTEHGKLMDLIPNYDLALNYSKSETFGMFLQECIGVGLPLLTTKVGWIRDQSYSGALDESVFQERLVEILTQKNTYQSLICDTLALSKATKKWNFIMLEPWL